jgi:hypothetical protein
MEMPLPQASMCMAEPIFKTEGIQQNRGEKFGGGSGKVLRKFEENSFADFRQ